MRVIGVPFSRQDRRGKHRRFVQQTWRKRCDNVVGGPNQIAGDFREISRIRQDRIPVPFPVLERL